MGEDSQRLYLNAKRIAMAALDLPAPQREAHVQHCCTGDDALLAEVEWMLQAAGTTQSPEFLLLRCADDSGSSISSAATSDYRVERKLGEGGMGAVYLAERVVEEGMPGEIRQPVALKFLNMAGVPSVEMRRRFAEERRILATLNHANIAHMVDGGTTSDGRPYLALEYVQGERIDRWCDRRQLALRQRIDLFLKVCGAVQYAHSRLVIHRDIKPANILVGPEGEPKLLDFGIARLLDHVGGVAAAQTVTTQRALTLAYASPEQVRGHALSTSADIWSLGVVFYQLVCGTRPFDVGDEASPLDVSNAIITGNFPLPSRQVRRLQPRAGRLPRDIDAIVLKALRHDPAERYASVQEMAADLQRFLDARPVRARQGRRWYRARLFARRNRLALGATSVLLVLLSGFVMEREIQLRRVQLERDKTEAIAGFMGELFENADPTHARGNRITVREVLDRGSSQLKHEHTLDPIVRATLMLSIARAYNQLDMGGRAIPLLRLADTLLADNHGDALSRGRVLAALGRAYSMMIDLPSSAAADKQALTLLAKAPGNHAMEMLRVRINLRYDQVATLDVPIEQVVGDLRQIVQGFDQGQYVDAELQVQALAAYSASLAASGRDPDAIVVARRALDLAEHHYLADDPALVYYRFTLALVMMRSDPTASVTMFRQVIADYDRNIGSQGAGTAGMAGLLSYFGGALAQLGRHADAAAALERAVHLADGFAADSPDFYLGTVISLAQQYVELGRAGEAAALISPRREQIRARLKSGSGWAVNNAIDAANLSGALALQRNDVGAANSAFERAAHLCKPAIQAAAPDSCAAAIAGQGEAALAGRQVATATQALARLDAFNQRFATVPYSLRALDAERLRMRLLQQRGEIAAARQLAGEQEPIAAQRWGACSRQARGFAVLAEKSASSAGAACPAEEGAKVTMQ